MEMAEAARAARAAGMRFLPTPLTGAVAQLR